jgi:hypothetical protein
MNLFSFKFLKSAQAILVPRETAAAVPARQMVRPQASAVRPSRPSGPSRPLRVLCVRDPKGSGLSHQNSGRLVISGRMADVCAELDRMVQAQARLH